MQSVVYIFIPTIRKKMYHKPYKEYTKYLSGINTTCPVNNFFSNQFYLNFFNVQFKQRTFLRNNIICYYFLSVRDKIKK